MGRRRNAGPPRGRSTGSCSTDNPCSGLMSQDGKWREGSGFCIRGLHAICGDLSFVKVWNRQCGENSVQIDICDGAVWGWTIFDILRSVDCGAEGRDGRQVRPRGRTRSPRIFRCEKLWNSRAVDGGGRTRGTSHQGKTRPIELDRSQSNLIKGQKFFPRRVGFSYL